MLSEFHFRFFTLLYVFTLFPAFLLTKVVTVSPAAWSLISQAQLSSVT